MSSRYFNFVTKCPRLLSRLLAATMLAAVVSSCSAPIDNNKVVLPAPAENSTLGPGDRFKVQIVGEKDLPQDYEVASDGSADLPYIHRIQVQGLETHEVADLIRTRLMEAQILTDPSIVVTVSEHKSKRVTVLGQVQKPGSFPYSPGLTFLQAISMAGGLNSIASTERVNLTRQTKAGSKTVILNFDSLTDGSTGDPLLQAGDRIYVHERIF